MRYTISKHKKMKYTLLLPLLAFTMAFTCYACATTSTNIEPHAVNGHWLQTGATVAIDFTLGAAEVLPSSVYAVDTADLATVKKQYGVLKSTIKQQRQQLAQQYNQASTDSSKAVALQQARQYLHQVLVNDVFPTWYGTEWDFNGYTNHPRDGQIACGYFVSTTLKHTGININRYDVAKQYSHSIVKTLCTSDSIQRITNFDQLLKYLNNRPNDLYIVGLDSHVGFLQKSDEGIFFIHSNYIGPVAVEKELATQSEALQYSEVWVLGHLMSNDALIKKWLTGISIPVVE